MAGSGAQSTEGGIVVGATDQDVGKRGRGCTDLEKYLRDGGLGSFAV